MAFRLVIIVVLRLSVCGCCVKCIVGRYLRPFHLAIRSAFSPGLFLLRPNPGCRKGEKVGLEKLVPSMLLVSLFVPMPLQLLVVPTFQDVQVGIEEQFLLLLVVSRVTSVSSPVLSVFPKVQCGHVLYQPVVLA